MKNKIFFCCVKMTMYNILACFVYLFPIKKNVCLNSSEQFYDVKVHMYTYIHMYVRKCFLFEYILHIRVYVVFANETGEKCI